jgi:hypothetical protein
VIHEYWAGRVNAFLGPPAVVVPAVEEPPAPPPVFVVTNFEPTVEVFQPFEDEVLAELAALTESCGPWAAARTLFNPIGGDQR